MTSWLTMCLVRVRAMHLVTTNCHWRHYCVDYCRFPPKIHSWQEAQCARIALVAASRLTQDEESVSPLLVICSFCWFYMLYFQISLSVSSQFVHGTSTFEALNIKRQSTLGPPCSNVVLHLATSDCMQSYHHVINGVCNKIACGTWPIISLYFLIATGGLFCFISIAHLRISD